MSYLFFFFFKQKTAYEIYQCDWSSDVCSSDLVAIDAIPEAECVDANGEPLTADQRGEPQPETGGTMCDVGAFEVQP